jgi:hypothetical protein
MNQEVPEGIELAAFGFVRVNDLKFTRRAMSGTEREVKTVEVSGKMLGTRGHNNGYKVAITERGHVWLSFGNSADWQAEERMLKKLCPHGETGMFASCAIIVDCTEQIPMHVLLQRMKDPMCQPEQN